MKLGLGKWKKTRKREEYTEKKGSFWVKLKWVTSFGEVEKARQELSEWILRNHMGLVSLVSYQSERENCG